MDILIGGNDMDEVIYDLKPAKKVFSRIGLALFLILALSTGVQLLMVPIISLIVGDSSWLVTASWGIWVATFVPIYAIAIPVGLLVMKKLPAQSPAKNKLTGKQFFICIPICFCLMYAGNIIGNLLSALFSGGNAENALLDFAMDTGILKVVVMVILAPLLEELVFRKFLIDRTVRYGEKVAVVLSALSFALFHGNLFQFFYAFALGALFAYVYIRTGKFSYVVLLHGIINFTGSVLAPWVLNLVDLEAIDSFAMNMDAEAALAMLPGMLVYMLYALAVMGLAVAGLVLICMNRKKLVWQEVPEQLPKGSAARTVYANVGMVLFMAVCLALTVLSLI